MIPARTVVAWPVVQNGWLGSERGWVVLLRSTGGNRVELWPVGYQYSRAGNDWDANWLVIAGRARVADGREWAFEDPSLTTWDARSLAEWLTAAADGLVRPVTNPVEDDLLSFTEPNLAFSLAAYGDGELTLRVHLSLESAGPADLGFVGITCSPDELRQAGQQWTTECAAFPPR